MDYLDDLRTRQGHAAKRLHQIIDDAQERAQSIARNERRAISPNDYSLSPEEQANLEQADAEYARYKAEADRLAGHAARTAATDQLRAGLMPAIRAMREDPNIAAVSVDSAGYLTRAIYGSEQHVAFDSFRQLDLGYEARALQSAGGSAIPTTFADFVTVYERTLNPMLDVARVFSTRSGAPLTFPRVTADVVAGGSVTAEAGGITESDPTMSAVTLGAFKLGHTTIYSAELDQDEVVNLDSILADAIARPIGLGWGTFFTLGTGTTQPWGFLARAQNGGTASGTADYGASGKYIGWGDAVTLQYSLAAPYRLNGSWQTNSMARIRQWRDTNNNPIFQPSLVAGAPDLLLGRPIYENPVMQAAGSANTALAFGDFSRYYLRDVVPMRVDLSREYKFNTDQLALRVITRRDGDLVDTAAVRFLVSQAV
jgi:HK97 family phage major capsid protein